jgi:PhnB protein
VSLSTTTHINLRGDARAALEHYREVFGGEMTIATYADAGAASGPDDADLVLWGQVESADGFRVMAYDVPGHLPWEQGVNGYFVSVRGSDPAVVSARWAGLSAGEGASVVVPLGPAAWSPLYGMLRDRFGVVWVLDVAVAYDGT